MRKEETQLQQKIKFKITTIDASIYFENGSVINGGVSGVYGEIGWFIPQYLVDQLPTVIVPSVLANDETIREEMINAMINGSDTNWIDKFYEIRNITEYKQTVYDLPNTTRPTCFGSSDSYAMSVYSEKQADNTGIDWNFVTLGGEGILSEYIYEMYTNRLPFVANLYRYDEHFAIILALFSRLVI